ncbi:MAG TPA: hypothetical protein EYG11_06530 [Candidatus Latescibacteria bacterium]|nr:hypothetical protein [Candidatus Handelsmanbacteria bacterium]HIL08339.1 hypothetical protein [Candidatus Latescibacterota bacterium]
MNDNTQRAQFERDGLLVCENILDAATVDCLNLFSDTLLAEQDAEHFERHRTTGSMVLIDWAMAYENLLMGELIAHRKALDALAQLGFTEPKFGHGRVISKPPHSPPLFWHEDGRFWDDPVSYTPQPIQVFLMYYLSDTTPENGCLRVIPGSHLTRHALHDLISPRHTESLTTYADPTDPGFCKVDEEIDVPVKAGDLVIGYGSLLHASHGNRSDQRRTVLTMWYYPDFAALPQRTQATVAALEKNNGDALAAAEKTRRLLQSLKIEYRGNAEPIEAQLTPGPALK